MQMPTVGAEQKRLAELFVGTWKGEEKLYPSEWDPKGGPAFGTWTVRTALDGFVVLVDYAEERDGKVVYTGHGVHGWDAAEQAYVHYWFDNIGVMPKQPTKSTLEGTTYSYRSDDGSRMTYRWSGAANDTLEFKIEKSTDGTTWKPMHEGRYQKV